jgi:transaldolase
MRKGGIHDYENFAQDILKHIKDKPISFEVFSDGSVRTRAASAF